jgi:hypothetical protein
MRVTNWKRKAILSIAATGALSVAAPTDINAQTTLVFEDSGLGNNVNIGGTGYGNNAAGTPNVVLNWSDGWQNYLNWDGRGVVGQLDYNVSGNNPITLDFVPDSGIGVFVSRFDLDTYASGGNVDLFWEILSGANVIDSGSYLNPSGVANRTTFTTNMSAATAVFGTLTLRVTRNDGFPSYLAADNITFAQIPEPTSAMLLLGGLGAMALRRRRN